MARPVLLPLLFLPFSVLANHSPPPLGAAYPAGPGAPLATSSSQPLAEGQAVAQLRLDHVEYFELTLETDDEHESDDLWTLGFGYGLTPFLSFHLFQPYRARVVDDHDFSTSGYADIELAWSLAFGYRDGFELGWRPDSRGWDFTLYGTATVPTGAPDTRNRRNEIHPPMSPGYGEPVYRAGVTAATRVDRFLLNSEASRVIFQEHTYDDKSRYRFGDQSRLNLALGWVVAQRQGFRMDAVAEANYLAFERDEREGVSVPATGGEVLYSTLGARGYWNNVSLSLGFQEPRWTDLNEESQQQGTFGTEEHRILFSFLAHF